MVAQLRGVRMVDKFGSFYLHDDATANEADKLYFALEGVARWLGFDESDEYTRVLEIEREKIFERATY